MTKRFNLLVPLAGLWLGCMATAAELGTAFTYQGQLLDAGEVAEGAYDLQWTLYDAASGGVSLQPSMVQTNVVIHHGQFQTTLDYGADVFRGQARWLEIGVRPGGSTVAFTPLSPRQALLPSPYALFAPVAGTASSADTASTASGVPWDGVSGMPAGFDDGVDNDTTYGAGVGLLLSNGEFRADFATNGTATTVARSDHVHPPGDAATLDGLDSTDFARAVHPHDFAELSGTASDSQLSTNIARLDAEQQIFGGANSFEPSTDVIGFRVRQSSVAAPTADIFAVQSADGSTNHLRVDRDGVFSWTGTASGRISGDGSGLTQLDAGSITSGILLETRLDAAVARDDEILPTVLDNDGTGSGLDADLLDGLTASSLWQLGGNGGTSPGTDFIGTADAAALELKVNGERALRLEPDPISPNLVGGSFGNVVAPGIHGVVIGGGGEPGAPNEAHAHFTTVGGGYANTILGDSDYASISGGWGNRVESNSQRAVIVGGQENVVGSDSWWAVVGGGEMNRIGTNANWATVPGGRFNVVEGNLSLAGGHRAQALHDGTFVWADTVDEDFSSSTDNEFAVRATGGVRFETGGAGLVLDGAAVVTTPVQTAALADDSITSLKIVDGAVTITDLATNSVDGTRLVDGGVGTPDLADDAVVSAKIADGTIQDIDVGVLSHLTASDGNPTNAVIVDADGRVGLGMTTPTRRLDVAGDGIVRGQSFTNEGDTATLYLGDANHYIRSVHSSGVRIGTLEAPDLITLQEGTGNVGIGTTGPEQRLHVVGGTRTDGEGSGQKALTVVGTNDASGIEVQTDGGVAIWAQVTGAPGLWTDAAINAVLTDDLSVGGFSDTAISGYARDDGVPRGVAGWAIDTDTADGWGGAGAYGLYMNDNYGTLGSYTNGVYGEQVAGVTAGSGVYGYSSLANGNGVIGEANEGTLPYGVWGKSSTGYAGFFSGNVHVTGDFSVGGAKSFKIDHPMDPENKYLLHACVEGPDRMNLYSGNVVLDGAGEAWVDLPAWFEALNRDFRYQLTAVGAPGPSLYIADEISDNRFRIAGGEPGMKVSWQVTGIRHDRWAAAHPMVVEQDKRIEERGYYVAPEAFGKTIEKGVEFARKGTFTPPKLPPPIEGRPAKPSSVP